MTASTTPAHKVEQIAQTTRYTSYTVYRRLSGLTEDGELTESQIAGALSDITPLIEAEGAEILGFYDVSGFRAEADLMVWLAAEEPAALQRGLRELERSVAGTWLHREWSAVGVHRMAEFAKGHIPSFMDPSMTRKQWITVYPFVRSYDWYLLPDDERRKMLADHGRRGAAFRSVVANTMPAFALGDYEWMLPMESDSLTDLVDMMRDLRYTEARLHVREEVPFFTGRRIPVEEIPEVVL